MGGDDEELKQDTLQEEIDQATQPFKDQITSLETTVSTQAAEIKELQRQLAELNAILPIAESSTQTQKAEEMTGGETGEQNEQI